MIVRKGQSTAEYAILISLVIAAALGIQNEVRRAIQARIHDAATNYLVTETNQLGSSSQYEPGSGVKTTTNQYSKRDRIEDPNADPENITSIVDESGSSYTSTETR